MRSFYACLLRLYPHDYRSDFAAEMTDVFESQRRDHGSASFARYALFLLTELAGLVLGAIFDWLELLTPRAAFLFARLGGLLLTALIIGSILGSWHFPQTNFTPRPWQQSDTIGFVILACTSVVLVAGLSIAFVINLKWVAQRRSRQS